MGLRIFYAIDYSVLNLPDTLAVLYTTYLQDKNHVLPFQDVFKREIGTHCRQACRTGCSAKEWIQIFEPEYSKDKVIYPGERTKQLFDEE